MKPSVALSQIAARFHRWGAASALLAGQPVASLDRAALGRLSYTLMMTARTDPRRAQRLLQQVLRSSKTLTPALLLDLSDIAVRVHDPATAKTLLHQALEASSDPVTTDVATRLLRLLNDAEDGSLQSRIEAMVEALHLKPAEPLTLAPVSGQFLDMWQLWHQQTRRHIGGTVVALAMNEASLKALTSEPDTAVIDAREFFSWDIAGKLHPRTRGVLWYIRTLFLRELVRRGHTTLVLDLDAIAIADVAPMLASLPPADVIAQKDYSIPVDVARDFGFVLCCGFMQWHSTPASIALLDRFAAAAAIERDDQLALNHLLQAEGISNKTEDILCLQFTSAGAHFVLPPATLVSRSLETGTVVRHFHQQGKTVPELKAALGIH